MQKKSSLLLTYENMRMYWCAFSGPPTPTLMAIPSTVPLMTGRNQQGNHAAAQVSRFRCQGTTRRKDLLALLFRKKDSFDQLIQFFESRTRSYEKSNPQFRLRRGQVGTQTRVSRNGRFILKQYLCVVKSLHEQSNSRKSSPTEVGTDKELTSVGDKPWWMTSFMMMERKEPARIMIEWSRLTRRKNGSELENTFEEQKKIDHDFLRFHISQLSTWPSTLLNYALRVREVKSLETWRAIRAAFQCLWLSVAIQKEFEKELRNRWGRWTDSC